MLICIFTGPLRRMDGREDARPEVGVGKMVPPIPQTGILRLSKEEEWLLKRRSRGR